MSIEDRGIRAINDAIARVHILGLDYGVDTSGLPDSLPPSVEGQHTKPKSSGVIFKKLRPDATIPLRGTPHAAGFDLFAVEDAMIGAGAFIPVHTGVAIQLPPGHYGQIAPRSGLAVRNGVIIGAGIIDVDYTGELIVCASVLNGVFKVPAGTKIAQLIPIKYADTVGSEGEFSEDRPGGHAGFGSTGM